MAGGEGSRMGHVNKGLQNFRGKKLIEHVIERLEPQVDDIVISANDDIEQYQTFGYPVIADVDTSLGPLSGIYSAATQSKHNQIFITACDMPYLPINIVDELVNVQKPVVVAKSNEGIEPLVSLVNQGAIQTIEPFLASGRRSVMKWLESCEATTFEASGFSPQAFFNINTLQELSTKPN